MYCINIHFIFKISSFLLIKTSNNQRLRSSKVQRCALRKFHMTDGQNTRDQITSDRRYVHAKHA